MRVIVVGAGVVGLTSAVCLAERGVDVHVLARDLPLETTSATAAAWWYPYRALPQDRVTAWAGRSYEVFSDLAFDSRSGVTMRDGVEVHRSPQLDPWWRGAVPSLERVHDLPAGYVDGWRYRGPVVEMPVYLPFLRQRLQEAGGTLTRLAVAGLPRGADAVVNCTGLASRALVGDHRLQPVRGQVVRLSQVGLDTVWLDASGATPTYVVPRSADIIVGGTDEEGSWDMRPDPTTAADILARATALVPTLAAARVLGHRVGLRPGRAAVRLEREQRANASPVVHCYGHGGAGVTLSWGCAEEVAVLVGAGAQNSRSAVSSIPRSAS
jgi:D-amino-acid oxidase